MWSLSLASGDMATDSQPAHSQPAPISARYPVPHAEEAASQALVLGLARAMSKPREQTTTTNRNLAHPSKETPGAGALFCGGFNTPPGTTAAPWGSIMTTGLNGGVVAVSARCPWWRVDLYIWPPEDLGDAVLHLAFYH